MPIERQRLLELALEKLQSETARIDQEIAELKAELTAPAPSARAERRFTQAQRKARSAAMKEYWRKRKQAEKK